MIRKKILKMMPIGSMDLEFGYFTVAGAGGHMGFLSTKRKPKVEEWKHLIKFYAEWRKKE